MVQALLIFLNMPNPKGNPENLKPIEPRGEETMTTSISFRCTQEMKNAVRSQPDPPEFCRKAIQKALDELGSEPNPEG